MAELFKFRCYQCQKLIGAPASKFGKVVNCPRCEVELIVPSPEGVEPEPEPADPDAFRPEDFGIRLESERLASPKPSPPASFRQAEGPDPIAFLQTVSEEPPAFHSIETEQAPPEIEAEGSEILPEPEVEPLVTRGRGRGGIAHAESVPRARDVILPRTAAVAWSLFGILGLGFAFCSGLFVGHFLWK